MSDNDDARKLFDEIAIWQGKAEAALKDLANQRSILQSRAKDLGMAGWARKQLTPPGWPSKEPAAAPAADDLTPPAVLRR